MSRKKESFRRHEIIFHSAVRKGIGAKREKRQFLLTHTRREKKLSMPKIADFLE